MQNAAAEYAPAPTCHDTARATLLDEAEEGTLSLARLIDGAAHLTVHGGASTADTLYRAWLAQANSTSQAYVARFNFAVSLAERGKLSQARDMLLVCLDEKPDFLPACINLGTILERMGNRPGAIAAWQRLTLQLPQIEGDKLGLKTTALNQIARVLEGARIEAPAETAMRASLELNPAQPEVIQHFVALRQSQCVWPTLADIPGLTALDQMRAISPLSLAAQIDDPILQLANAHAYHSRDARLPGITTVGTWPPPRDRKPRVLRIGYVSSDLRAHAIGFLTARVFGLHDRNRVEVTAYYCGPKQEDALQVQFRQTADQWRDINLLSDREAAAQIVRDGIDILVDVNGYTKDGRIKLFSLRPAPVIVNWLGFPGSLGSPHHHYIIADSTIIPPGDECFYAEDVMRLPCYQPNDPTRVVAANGQTRAQANLPEDAFVFCVFNGPQKIIRPVFATWMQILHDTPASVLWMLCDGEDTRERLRALAEAAGVDPARLIFAGRMGNAEHLARYRLADLFLDTAPYGAHTTASDALWMGVPVLTRAGNSFAARVCASLVRSAGIPDLVAADWQDYRAIASSLALEPARLRDVGARLEAARGECALFDTAGLVRALEDCYEQMWCAYSSGTLPQPMLDHLPRYREIGIADGRSCLPERADLLSWYERELLYRDAMLPIAPDPLLWRGTMPNSQPAATPTHALAA